MNEGYKSSNDELLESAKYLLDYEYFYLILGQLQFLL